MLIQELFTLTEAQHQGSTKDQIVELIDLAHKNGLYDAADAIRQAFPKWFPNATVNAHHKTQSRNDRRYIGLDIDDIENEKIPGY